MSRPIGRMSGRNREPKRMHGENFSGKTSVHQHQATQHAIAPMVLMEAHLQSLTQAAGTRRRWCLPLPLTHHSQRTYGFTSSETISSSFLGVFTRWLTVVRFERSSL